jgi:hypothetical protein
MDLAFVILSFYWALYGTVVKAILKLLIFLFPYEGVLLENLKVWSARQEIPAIMWNPQVRYRFQKNRE